MISNALCSMDQCTPRNTHDRYAMNTITMQDSANKNFSSARTRSFFQSVYSKLKKEDDCLPSLNDIVKITKAKKERYLGIKEIPLDNIIGSEGRYEEFNKNFFPKIDTLQPRWTAIHRVMETNKPLPPISVYKIDDYYFVRDGNHRVSVAKIRKMKYIDAEVTEYEIDVPITKELTIKDRIKIQEHVHFLEATGLNQLGKGFDIKLTRPQSYRLLLNIIQHFSKPLEEFLDKGMSLQEVAKEWYYRIFLPFAEGAYMEDLLAKFPHRTTGDLYVWIHMNWNEVEDSLGERLHCLAKPIASNGEKQNRPAICRYTPGIAEGMQNALLWANIGLVVTCSIVNISRQGEISIAIVKRKYHPFEDYWSLPIAIMRANETRFDGAKRCVECSLGIKNEIRFVPYKTFDNVDRTPYGRMIAFGTIGIHYGENTHMSAGGLASEIKLIGLSEKIALVYDHNRILNEALQYIYRIRNNFSFIQELFPDTVPLQYIRKLIREVEEICSEKKSALFDA